jgi:cytochrome P450
LELGPIHLLLLQNGHWQSNQPPKCDEQSKTRNRLCCWKEQVGRRIRYHEPSIVPYLQAIVKETLRLHPTGPIIVRESSEHCTIAGYKIPAKTRLFVNVWAIGRDPKHWENPLEFRPERFIGEKSQLDVRGQHFHLLPFGSGRRGCPGTSLALQVVQTTLATLIHFFEWKVVGGDGDGDGGAANMEEEPGLTLPRAHPLVCVPAARLNPFPSIS